MIIGALSTAFMVYGIALVYGFSHTLNFTELAGLTTKLGSQLRTALDCPEGVPGVIRCRSDPCPA
jgi:NADH:ubiquinone oxidoreductase subunit 2 (subunit N)